MKIQILIEFGREIPKKINKMKKVWINGTFDILHIGHIRLFTFAKSFGTVRVGLDTDERVRSKKGILRPINTLSDRMEFISSLNAIDSVVSFNDDDELIARIKQWEPDYFVIGSDYRDKKIIGEEFAKEIIFFERLNYSSTDIINKIQEINEKESSSRRRIRY